MSLRNKLVFLFLVVSMLPILIVGYSAYDNSRGSLEEVALNRLRLTNTLKRGELERWLLSNKALIQALAQRPLVREYAKTITQSNPDDADYQAVSQQLLTDHLVPTLSAQGGFLMLSILSPVDGRVLLSTDETLQGKYRESEPFFIEGKTRTFIQNAEYNLAHQGIVMHVSTPISDERGNLIAVLAGHIDFDEMSLIMAQGQELTQTQETYLVNQSHFIITESRFMDKGAMVVAAHSTGVHDCLQHTSGTGHYDDYRGTAVIGAYNWLDERELCIVTEINQHEAFADIDTLRNNIFQIAGVVAVLFMGAAWLFARTLTTPISRLVTGTQQLRQGNLSYRVPARSNDELGTLAASFNEMADELSLSQTSLRASEERFRVLFESVDAIVTNVDSDGTFLFTNQMAEHQLGKSQEELTGNKMVDFFPPREAQRMLASIRQVIESGRGLIAENPINVSGEERWYRTSIQPVRDETNTVTSAIVIANDITDRIQAEKTLREERDFVSAVINTSAALTLVLDSSGRIIRFNTGCEKHSGYSFEEVQGTYLWDALLRPDEIPGVRAVFDSLVAGLFPNEHENYWVTKDGDQRLIAWSNTCLTDDDGHVKYLIGTGIDITDRKAAEAALRELNESLEERIEARTKELQASEGRFRRAIQEAPFPIILHAEDGEVILINDAWTEISGYTLEDIPTISSWVDKAYGSDSPTVQAGINRLYDLTHKVDEGEYTIKTSDRRTQIWAFSSSPLGRMADGRRFVLSMAMDITPLKQAEQILSEERNLLRTLIDNLPDHIYIKDTQSRFLNANSALVKSLGMSGNEEITGKAESDFLPSERTAEYLNVEQEVIRTGEPVIDQEIMGSDHAGHESWMLCTRVPVRNQDGDITGLVGINRDITQLKLFQEHLKKRNAEIALLFDAGQQLSKTLETDELFKNLRDIVDQVMDCDGLFVSKYDPEEQLIQCVYAFGEDAQIDISQLPAIPLEPEGTGTQSIAILTGEPLLIADYQARIAGASTYHHVAQNGSVSPRDAIPEDEDIVRSALIVPLKLKQQVTGVVQIFSYRLNAYTEDDLRMLQALAPQLAAVTNNALLFQQAQDEIERRIRAEQTLAQNARELERSNQELQQFAYVASHDLQEPLRMVSSYLQLLERRYKDRLDSDATEFIAYAVDGANRMKSLINDLLMYSRVGTRGKPFEPVDCNKVVSQSLKNLKLAIDETEAHITHDPLPTVSADADQLIQLFQNLISNAIKFCDKPHPEIHISAQEHESRWTISVQDNGIGIETNYFDRIFIIFQRLHGKLEYPGTGIGLAITKKIVERHSGQIWVTSEPGKGSTFHFTLPKRKEIEP